MTVVEVPRRPGKADDQVLDLQQRFGGATGVGFVLVMIRPPSARRCGNEDSSSLRVGLLGARRRSASTSARSTMSPSFMTLTVSHRSATTPRLWVTRIIASPRSRLSSRSSSSTSAWTVTSSAVVGSSATMMSGSEATAPQISTRCAMPPEISCG